MIKLLEPRSGRFLVKTDTPTELQIGADSEGVFVDDPGCTWFLPLVSFPLSTVNSNWDGRAHIIYGGPHCEASAFRRVDGGQRLEYIGSLPHSSEDFVSFGDDSFDEDLLYDEVFEEEDLIESTYAEVIDVEMAALDLDADSYAIGDQMRELLKPINAQRRDAGHSNHCEEMGLLSPYNRLVGPPLWLHSEPELKPPSGSRDLYFLGQVNSFSIGDLADFMVYLFYCPDEDVLVTTMQMT